jgi:hypothetical protein
LGLAYPVDMIILDFVCFHGVPLKSFVSTYQICLILET